MAVSLWRACIVEFFATLLFQLVGGSASSAPFNGLILVVIIYMTAAASGGVVNPAVSTTLFAAGEMDARKWIAYMVVQLMGATFGALIGRYADVNFDSHTSAYWGVTVNAPGCVPDIMPPQYVAVFVWEFVGTFMLCATVLATAVAKPGFGNLAPLAIGLSVAVNVDTSGSITGGCYNPARFFGPAMATGCRMQLIWLYFVAEYAAALLAALWHTRLLEQGSEATPIIRESEVEAQVVS